MSVRTLYLRAGGYVRRHGMKSSLKRVFQEAKNQLVRRRLVIFWMDLLSGEFEDQAMPENCSVERYDKRSEMPERLLKRISEHYSEELQQDYIRKRFEKGAHLWCMRNAVEDIGYLWSIEGQTMKPYYYFPLMACDVHLDDGFIFPPYRGQGMFTVLNNHIFKHYKHEGYHRVYEEVAEWNTASLKSASKNGFVQIGLARMRLLRGKCKVTWWYGDADEGK